MKLLNQILSSLIQTIRPILGPANCKFNPTCTPYALNQLKTKPLHKAIVLITKRVLSCNPFWS